MGGLLAISRQTVIQCLRTRAVVVFLLLLAVMLAAMPFMLTGDGTLAGRSRTFLSYSTSLTLAALSVLTVFFTVSAVSEDVRTRRIFSVAVKPVSRWQYILGRWLGVMALNTILVVVSAGGIYAMAMYLRTGAIGEAINARDRAAVETEVFTARKRISPIPKDIEAGVAKRIKEITLAGELEEKLSNFTARYGSDAEARFYEEIYNQVAQGLQSVKPGTPLTWDFQGVDVAGQDYHSTGRAVTDPNALRLRVETGKDVIGRLVFRGPVLINGVEAWVERFNKAGFDARFYMQDFDDHRIQSIEAGDEVSLTVEPTIQITYKASSASSQPDGRLRSQWIVADPGSGTQARPVRDDPVRQQATLTLAARVVGRVVDVKMWEKYRADEIARGLGIDGADDDNQRERILAEARQLATSESVPSVDDAPPSVLVDVRVSYYNLPHPLTGRMTGVTILDEDISVLFRLGSFEANFTRGVLLMLIQLSYVAALGVLAGSFLAFPVGCLMVFTLLPFSVFRQYLTEAVTPPPSGDLEWYIWPGRITVRAMAGLLPDLEGASPGPWLVDGMYMSWSFVSQVAVATLLLRAGVVLVLACLIFRSRELARVQV